MLGHYRKMAQDLCFVGTANWDIYSTASGGLVALRKDGDTRGDSAYGDKHHIRRLMANGWFNDVPTEQGLAFMQGLYSCIYHMGTEKQFSVLRFSDN